MFVECTNFSDLL